MNETRTKDPQTDPEKHGQDDEKKAEEERKRREGGNP